MCNNWGNLCFTPTAPPSPSASACKSSPRVTPILVPWIISSYLSLEFENLYILADILILTVNIDRIKKKNKKKQTACLPVKAVLAPAGKAWSHSCGPWKWWKKRLCAFMKIQIWGSCVCVCVRYICMYAAGDGWGWLCLAELAGFCHNLSEPAPLRIAN